MMLQSQAIMMLQSQAIMMLQSQAIMMLQSQAHCNVQMKLGECLDTVHVSLLTSLISPRFDLPKLAPESPLIH